MISAASVVTLVISLLVLAAVYMLVDYLVRTVPIADPFGRVLRLIVMVICVLVAIILLLQWAGLISASVTPIPLAPS
jgi:hypothetical protein